MEITEGLIQNFFNGKCTAEEAELVAEHLHINPELFDKYFKEDEEEFSSEKLSKKETESLLKNIKKQTQGKLISIKLIKTIASIAASLLFIFCLYQMFSSDTKTNTQTIAQTRDTLTQPWKFRMNNTNEVITASLEDGTLMHLQPHSFVKYQSFTGQTKRDVFLNGEVFFKVAKDKTKPFTVYAGNLTTTALGTQFTIQDNKEKTTIQLFEGKVVIKSIVPNKKWIKDVFLTPGQQLVFNKKDSNVIVGAIGDTSHLNIKKQDKENLVKVSSTIKTGNWYMFNNQSLHNVFEQLGEIYNIKIDYKNVDISNVYFIGRFEKTDSVEVILNNIALLKKLHIEHRNNTYIITKN